MKRIAIIGAGISGLAAGQLLGKHFEVKIFDSAAKPGGLVKCDRVNDNLFHRVGGHVFNSRNPAVLDWFWSFFDRDAEFLKARRNARILLNGKTIGYPIENYLYQLDKKTVDHILSDFLNPDYAPRDPFSYENFAQFLKANFGQTLYDLYFQPYNQKIWNRDLTQIPLEWLDGKLPMPNLKQMLLSNIVKEEETEMVHATFYYAKENGSQFIANRLAQDLDIQFQTPVDGVHFENGKLKIEGFEPFDAVVYTGDIRRMQHVFPNIEIARHIQEQCRHLPSNSTSNLFCETDPGDISWLYLPDPAIKAHRIIYTGTFAPSNNRGSKRHTCVVEFSGLFSYEEMCEEIKKLPGNLAPLAWNHEPNSYIIHQPATYSLIAETKRELAEKNIFLLGRFAEWQYYNMDKAIEAAMDLDRQLQAVFLAES